MTASGEAVPDDRRRVDGEAELCSQEFQDPLVDVGGALHHQEVPGTFDQLGLRSWAAVVRHPVDLLLGHAVTPVKQLGSRLGLRREVALADYLHAEGAWRALPASSAHSRRR